MTDIKPITVLHFSDMQFGKQWILRIVSPILDEFVSTQHRAKPIRIEIYVDNIMTTTLSLQVQPRVALTRNLFLPDGYILPGSAFSILTKISPSLYASAEGLPNQAAGPKIGSTSVGYAYLLDGEGTGKSRISCGKQLKSRDIPPHSTNSLSPLEAISAIDRGFPSPDPGNTT
jgi:hypothetical protein